MQVRSERGPLSDRRTQQRPSRRRSATEALAVAAGIAAVVAPASLTGLDAVDAVQRGVVATLVTFVGAHGRRRTWLLAGALAATPSGGLSMLLVLIGLAVAVASTFRDLRSRRFGAVAVGCYVNAIFWYPPHDPPWGVAVGIAVLIVLIASGVPNLRSHRRRAVQVVAAGTAAFVVVACVLVGVAMLLAGASVASGGDAAKAALEAARDGDGETADRALTDAGADFEQAAGHLDGFLALPAQVVPGVAQQLQAVRTTVDQGRAIADAGNDLVRTADYDRLQYDGRLDLDQVAALVEPTERADRTLEQADAELAALQEGTLLPPLRDGIEQFADKIEQARRDTEVARALVTTAPQLFAAGTERHYLIIFLTPAELRGAGGFIGSYAELRAIDGEVDLVRSGRIDDLIEAAPVGSRTISGPEDYLARYGRFRPADFVQDVTFSPHFPSSASVIAELYPQSGGRPVDGVIGVDPTGIAALLELTGPVEVDGLPEPLTAEDAADLLTRRQYLELGTRAERGEILEAATRATFDELVSSSLPTPRRLADVLSPAARGGHLRMWSPIADEQDLFEQLGADGSLTFPENGDGFSVVQRNVGNNKIDAYLRRSLTYDATIDARTGDLAATLRIELTNEVPVGVDLPPGVADNTRAAPTLTNVTVVTIHTPHQVRRATLDGEELLLGPDRERGYPAWDTPDLLIGPGETVVLEVEMTGALDLRDGYDLRILPQPVANPDELRAHLEIIGGRTADTGERTLDLVDPGPMLAPVERTVELRR